MNSFKNIFGTARRGLRALPLTVAGICLVTSAVTAAPPDAVNVFGVGTTNGASTLSWVIVPANSINGGAPVVTSIDAATDTPNTAVVQGYLCIEQAQASAANTTVSIPIGTTNTGTKWDSGTIIIRHVATETYEKRTLATSGGQTNLEVTVAPITAVASGDIIYKAVTTGAPALSMQTNTIAANRMWLQRNNATGLIVGQKGKPLLLEVSGTASTAATLYNASGYYSP